MSAWTYTFQLARTEKGSAVLNRAYFDRVVMASLAVGEVCDLTICEHVEKRTNAQNRLIWGTTYDQIIDGIMLSVGYEFSDKKERAIAKAALHEAMATKYQGTVTDKATGLQVRKFYSHLATKDEFSAYVEWLAREAAREYGVVVVLPGEAA